MSVYKENRHCLPCSYQGPESLRWIVCRTHARHLRVGVEAKWYRLVDRNPMQDGGDCRLVAATRHLMKGTIHCSRNPTRTKGINYLTRTEDLSFHDG